MSNSNSEILFTAEGRALLIKLIQKDMVPTDNGFVFTRGADPISMTDREALVFLLQEEVNGAIKLRGVNEIE